MGSLDEVTVLATQDFLGATQAQHRRRLGATWSERGRAKSSPMLSLVATAFPTYNPKKDKDYDLKF